MERTILEFSNSNQFESWLETNHSLSSGVWLKLAKKGVALPSFGYAQALDCALCFGWIDGQKAKLDESFWLQYFVKRKKNSLWSQVNRTHVARLTEAGKMRPSGRHAVEDAKSSGQWERAYQPGKSREVPTELAQALKMSPKASAFFESLDSRNRFAFVFRSSTPKNEETRQNRAKEFVDMMEKGEVFYPKKQG